MYMCVSACVYAVHMVVYGVCMYVCLCVFAQALVSVYVRVQVFAYACCEHTCVHKGCLSNFRKAKQTSNLASSAGFVCRRSYDEQRHITGLHALSRDEPRRAVSLSVLESRNFAPSFTACRLPGLCSSSVSS